MVAPINSDGIEQFTQKQLRGLWNNVSLRTVQRKLRRHGAVPVAYTGIQPIYTAAEIERVDREERKLRAKQLGHPLDERDGGAGIITMRDLKRAKRRARR